MKITWLGHSCFKIESQGYQIVLDPYQEGRVPGYKPIRERADQVLCSHGHGDHCAVECVTLRSGTHSPFSVETIDTWHDGEQGALRGANTIHILNDGQCRIAHLGDLGCALTLEQERKLSELDALLIPVGGHYTIDAAQARRIVDQLAPRVVIPMHYRGTGFGYDVIGTLDQFAGLCGDIVTYPSSELELTPQTQKQTAILQPKNV